MIQKRQQTNERPRFTPRFLAILLSFPSPFLLHLSPLSSSLQTSSARGNQKHKNEMLLGKRPRPPMKRTTSLSEITFDLNTNSTESAAAPHPDPIINQRQVGWFGGGQLDQRFLAATVSPRTHRRASVDFLETAHFLRACSLCKRRLIPGRDIYMYKGDSAFCSLECRQQQMNQDERKEKCSMASKKEIPSATTTSEVSTKGETVAAL